MSELLFRARVCPALFWVGLRHFARLTLPAVTHVSRMHHTLSARCLHSLQSHQLALVLHAEQARKLRMARQRTHGGRLRTGSCISRTCAL